ncbi:DUF4349 domain-containing protein [Candidatus Spongiisocius sp.]|uniref:DUF4349 domain-containing protein n=1 Tax=Candidatus Spongiisocius sp. TaxID=3101273 RepID=UPI003B5BC2BF
MRSRFLYCLILLVILLAVACSLGGEDEAAPAATVAAAAADASVEVTTTAMMSRSVEDLAEAEEAAADGESALDSSVTARLPVATPADLGRDVIYRGTISVQALDVEAAAREAVSIVQGLGGIVFGQQVSSSPEPESQLTFKVMPTDFLPVLESLSGVGELVDKKITADDVTERIVDFRSRISTAEASVLRLRDLLQEAPDLENVALIERELVQRETDLETLRGRLRTLTDAVSLATIDMTIFQLYEPVPDTGIDVAAWVSDSDEDPCLGNDALIASPDDDAYFCVQVENTGEVALTDVEVSSAALRLRPQDQRSFQLVAGSFDRIEPGELLSAVMHVAIREGRIAGRVATRGGIEVGFEVTGTPVPDDGVPMDTVTGFSFAWVVVDEEEGPPSFIGAVQTGYRGMVRALGYVVAIIGLLIPFVPAVVVIGGFYWWFRRLIRGRRSARSTPADSSPNRPQHPPDAPSG